MKRTFFPITICFFIMIIPILLLNGCVSTNEVTSIDQYVEINEQGHEYHALITVQVDSGLTEFAGNYVRVGRDSTQWLDNETQHIVSVATNNIHRIRFIKPTLGALEGLGIGVGLPAIVSALFKSSGVYTHLSITNGGIQMAYISAVIFGCVYGGSVGAKTDYVFKSP